MFSFNCSVLCVSGSQHHYYRNGGIDDLFTIGGSLAAPDKMDAWEVVVRHCSETLVSLYETQGEAGCSSMD